MIWNRDGITWYSEDEVESYKQSEQEGLEIVAELEHIIDCKNGTIETLKAENERLKEKFEIESLTDKTTGETIYRSNVVNKLKELLELRIEDLCESCGASSMMPMPCTVYKQTLQEIKDYLNTLSGIDNDFVNTETYLRILDLITKAESEG